LTRAVEASLRRLRTDYIDIYQLHAPSLDVLARGEFVEQLEILRQQGKIRYWGVAGDGPEHVESALAYSNLGAVQVGLSALEQTALDHAIPCATEHGVGVIARQVFASGLLTRDPESIATEVLDPEPSVGRRKHDQLRAFASIARVCGRTRTELALQFSLAQDGVSVVLVGLSRPNQLTDIERALNAPSLTLHERRALSATSHEPSPVTSAAPLPLA
jgi:aryl-alcohol dehydrogenase-like predicted oxidoreductase